MVFYLIFSPKPNHQRRRKIRQCLTFMSSICIKMFLDHDRTWLHGCNARVLACDAMWATLTLAQRTGRVGNVLAAVCMFQTAEVFLSRRGGNLEMMGLKRRIVPSAALCILLVFFLLMGQKWSCMYLHDPMTQFFKVVVSLLHRNCFTWTEAS